MTSTPHSPEYGYEDLGALQAAHARLIKQQRESPVPPDFFESVDGFIIRAQATGRVIANDDERTAAQSIIDYWVTVLLRERRTPPEAGLAEYGLSTPATSIRERSATEYLTEERFAIRRRLRLSAAAAQWSESKRDRALLWGGAELTGAEKYQDLTELEREFIKASSDDETRVAKLRLRIAIGAVALLGTILALVIGGLYMRARIELEHARDAQHRLAMTLVERAAVRMSDGDVAGSVAWLSQALHENTEAKFKEAQEADRLRLGAALAQFPKLKQLLIEENADYVTTLSKFSADGKHVLTVANPKGGGRGVARLYDAATGAKLADFPDAESTVNDAGFCADGRIVTAAGTSGSGRGRLRFWPRDGKTPLTVAGVENVVLSATLSADGTHVAILREKPATVEVRRVSDGETITGLLPWDGQAYRVAFSPNGARVAVNGAQRVTGDDGSEKPPQQLVRIWDLMTKSELKISPLKYDQPLGSIAFAPDNRRLVSAASAFGSTPSRVEVRDTEDGKSLLTINFTGPTTFAAFSPDAQRVVVANHETVRVFDASSGLALREFKHDSSVRQAIYSPDGRFIASGSRDRTARIWSVAAGRQALPPLSHGFTVTGVSFSPDGENLLTTSEDGARCWLLRTSEPLSPILQLNDPIRKMAISDDGRCIVAASRNGAVGRWELPDGEPVVSQISDLSMNNPVFFSDDGTLVLIADKNKARVWETKRLVETKYFHDAKGLEIVLPASPNYAAFSHDRKRLFIATGQSAKDGSACIFDLTSAQPTCKVLKVGAAVTFAVFSGDDRFVLTAGGISDPASGEARVWSTTTGEPCTPPLKHLEEVTCASFSTNLDKIVTGSVDDTAKLWDVDLARGVAAESRVLKEHTADITHAGISPDGNYIVTASLDRTAMIWDARSGKRLRVLQHPGAINDASFDRTNKHLVTACADQGVRIWEVPSGDWISLFRHEGEVKRAFFTPGEPGVVTLSSHEPATTSRSSQPTVSSSGNTDGGSEPSNSPTTLRARVWRLPTANGTDEELDRFSQLLLSRRTEAGRDLVQLDRTSLAANWNGGRNPIFIRFKDDHPKSSTLHTVEECEATGEWFASRWHLDRLLDRTPGDAKLLIRRGAASARLRDWERAAADYEKALEQQSDPSLLTRIAQVRIEMGDFEKAAQRATEALGLVENRELYMLRAETFAARKLWEEAAKDLKKSIELRPNASSAYSRLAVVRLKQGQLSEYVTLANRMVEQFGNEKSGLAGTAAWACVLCPDPDPITPPAPPGNNTSDTRKAMPDPKRIVELAKIGIADDPQSFYELNTLGAALYRAGEFQKAIDQLSISRDAYMQAASAAQMRGDAMALRLPLQDGRAPDWLFLAMANLKLDRPQRAQAWLERARAYMDSATMRDPRRTWHRLEIELLFAEAKNLIYRGKAAE